MTEQEWRWGAAENPVEAASFRKAARAAIEAMRDAEFRLHDETGAVHQIVGEPMSVWRHLFDAALASQGNGRER